jgi:hypothetical protein
MLATDERELLLDLLRPPEGYRFDRGIATTFTLDLLTLLIAPLSLALMEVSDAEAALADPLALLEGLRRQADRLTIFCQVGRIAVPRQDYPLFRLLEGMVVQVQVRQPWVFHPKVWLLRYTAEGQAPLYRFLNLSRNLTFDRSWDLALRLEGELVERQYAYSRNHPLGDFVKALPELATDPVDPRIAQDIAMLQDEVRRVAFQPPDPFQDELCFYPFAVPGYGSYRFNRDYTRVMMISPFLSDRLLQQVTASGAGHVLVSRLDSIAALKPKTRARFEKLYVLDDAGLDVEETPSADGLGGEAGGTEASPTGLHAKLFILEHGWQTTWLVGSANATDAAFRRRNVEFMVRLEGRRSRVGIDKVLGSEEEDSQLRALLKPYPDHKEVAETDQAQQEAEKLADDVRVWLIAVGIQLEVVPSDNERFDLQLTCANPDELPPDGGYSVFSWPVSLRRERRIDFDVSLPVSPPRFTDLSLLALTPFIAFEIVAQFADRRRELRFVLNLPVTGIPTDRDDRLFATIISDRSQFLRYLWLILAGGEDGSPAWLSWLGEETGAVARGSMGDAEMPLLETLVRALSRSPEKIERISDLVGRLKRTPEGQRVLPDGFEALWDAVVSTRRSMQ